MGERFFDVADRLDLAQTMRGTKTAHLISADEAWYSTRTPDGPATVRLVRSGERVGAEAWGDGALWLLEQAPNLLGASDSTEGFAPEGSVRQLWRRSPFRLSRTDRIWEALIAGILGQKVQTTAARRSRLELAKRYGDPAPGPRPAPTWVYPSADTVARLGYADLHPLGVERKRADTLIRAAREVRRLDDLDQRTPAEIRARLERIRGIGPWTSNLVTATALGDPDAVPLGDYHMPNTVGWFLARKERSTDAEMLELLEPYAGHRWRVIRMAKGVTHAPRRGPRLSITEIRDR